MTEGREPHSTENTDERRDRVARELEGSLLNESFFRGRSTASNAEADGSWTGRSPGDVIGDFRLVSLLGRGGMGQVWEAEQTSMGRMVALKLLHTHVQLSDDGVMRFEREAKAGGRLKHPGIVQIHSVGVSDGVHYMAQELVEGSYTLADSLADFRAETELPPGYYRKVAELFAEMADALSHAHENGVVHRDIKPSNILIGPDEKPKVADFGLAMVEDQLGLSRTGDFMGTPFYMSPEQAASKRMGIDHRTDVFSLGATMYEALTLVRPFTGDTSQQVFQQILVVDPQDPKRLRSRVPRDLAVICLKALEKNQDQRYMTMEEFGADLRRHLSDEPIRAKPPSVAQRTLKWVRRNPVKSVSGGVAAAAFSVIAALLVQVGSERDRAVRAEGGTMLERDRANEQRDRAVIAERETHEALTTTERAREAADEAASKATEESEITREVLDFMVGLFEISDPSEAKGETITAREVLDRGAERIEKELEGQPLIRARLLDVMGTVYISLGLTARAETLLLEALRTRREHLDDDHPDTIESVGKVGVLYLRLGRYFEAEPFHLEALEKSRLVLGDDNETTLAHWSNTASLYVYQGRLKEAELMLTQVVGRQRRVLGEEDPETLNSLGNLALVYKQLGKFSESESLYLEVLEKKSKVFGESDPGTLSTLGNVANLYYSARRFVEAHGYFRKAYELKRQVLGDDHQDTLVSLNNLGVISQALGKYPEAESLIVEALEKRRNVLGSQHPETLTSLSSLADLYKLQSRYEEAESLYLEALDAQRRDLGIEHPFTITTSTKLGSLYFKIGRISDAEAMISAALKGQRERLGQEHPSNLRLMSSLAAICKAQGRLEEAETMMNAVIELQRQELGQEHPDTLVSMNNLAALYESGGRNEEAETLYLEVLDQKRVALGDNDQSTLISMGNLGAFYVHRRRLKDAEPIYLEAVDKARASLIDGHATRVVSLLNLADLYTSQGRYDEARPVVVELMRQVTDSSPYYEASKALHDHVLSKVDVDEDR